ncbi:MAG: tripartite tricarboxylate transporter substrate binding protein [Pigmentiphaga sp.]|nr:tripartite tricarboxylate transporter substrate binding protein [Pigmentiphaga sp.]
METRPAFRTNRAVAASALVFGLLVSTNAAVASSAFDTYPEREITLIMPMPPAGPTDQLGRLLADHLGRQLGKQVIVANRPGAGGAVGATAAAQSPADGYTLLFGNSAALAGSPAIYKNLAYDPVKSFKPISPISTGHMVIVVGASSPIHSLSDLVRLSKDKPGTLNYGSAGNGSPLHIGGELLKMRSGADLTHIPYKGGAPALLGLLSGDVQIGIDLLPPLLPHLETGKIRALAVAGPDRLPMIPDVPTAAEAGIPGVELNLFTALVAPAGLPEPIAKKLNDAVKKIFNTPEFKEVADRNSFFLAETGSLEEAERFIQEQVAQWAESVEIANARVD